MLGPWCFKMLGNHVFRAFNSFCGIAAANVLICTDIILFLIKYPWCVRCSSFLNGMDVRQHLIFYLDQLLRLLCSFSIFCCDKCNGVPQIMSQAANRNQGILIVLQMADLILTRNILSCNNSLPPRKLFCFCCVNRKNTCPRIFASESHSVKHAFRIEIIRIFSGAKNLFPHINSCHTGSKLPVFIFLWNYALPHNSCGNPHCIYYFYIPCTATVIVAQGILDFLISWFFIYIQKSFGTHNHTRNAKTALYSSGFAVRIGIYFFFPIGQAFYCDHVFPFQGIRVRHTGFAGPAINDHGAGSAGALTAAVLYRGQMQFITQKAKQLLVFPGLYGLSIDCKCCHIGLSFLAGSPGQAYALPFFRKLLHYIDTVHSPDKAVDSICLVGQADIRNPLRCLLITKCCFAA